MISETKDLGKFICPCVRILLHLINCEMYESNPTQATPPRYLRDEPFKHKYFFYLVFPFIKTGFLRSKA